MLSESKFGIEIKIINYLIYWIKNQGFKQIKQSPSQHANQVLYPLLVISKPTVELSQSFFNVK